MIPRTCAQCRSKCTFCGYSVVKALWTFVEKTRLSRDTSRRHVSPKPYSIDPKDDPLFGGSLTGQRVRFQEPEVGHVESRLEADKRRRDILAELSGFSST